MLAFADAATWRAWLAGQGAASAGLWLRLAKRSAFPSVSKPQAIEEALAHGWIDGQLDTWDEASWLVRFTPRGPRSKWSQVNRDTAERLMVEGRMTSAGLAQVERARADGRWDAAYAPQSRAEIPDDLMAALDASPAAATFFATLTGANRYAILYRIEDAKFVAMCERGETVYPSSE